MKFRTEIQVAPLRAKIGYQSRMLALGSCFAEHISARLAQAKFRIVQNPSGILFNPMSVATAIRSFACGDPVLPEQLHECDGLWFHYGFHGSFSAPTADQALTAMNAARRAGTDAFRETDTLLLTFGTAWVYEHEGEVVANCHKQPASEFVRRRLSVDEIVRTYEALLAGPLWDKQIILTISPVRHLGDGLEGNAVSKATLRLAAEELTATSDRVHYFPAFEILTDDLRDYRFYAEDMVHPAPQAVEYVWEKFTQAALDDQALRLLPQIAQIVSAASHRPLHPRSEAFNAFCRKQLERIAALPQIDFHAEEAYFRGCIEINS